MPNRMYLLHALSSVHVGTGEGDSYVDLPLAREKVTNWPYIPGSGIKGVMSAKNGASTPEARAADAALKAAFGSGGDEAANAGALIFTDASLLLLPLRSVYGTFAYATSPLALRRFSRDLVSCGATPPALPEVAAGGGSGGLVPEGQCEIISGNNTVYLNDCDVTVERNASATQWGGKIAEMLFAGDNAAQTILRKRFLILADDVFTYFSEAGTEITTRIHVDPTTGTVAPGQLWTEESLPAESVLAGIVWCDRVYHEAGTITPQQLLDDYCRGVSILQIGGKATVGRGRVSARFVE